MSQLEGGGEIVCTDELKGGWYIIQADASRGSETQREDNRQESHSEELQWVWKSNRKPKADGQTSSMRALVVFPLLLCAVVCVDQVRAEVKAVKLCGREFLRAVVYTCGGSRWRRLLTDTDMEGLATGEQSSLESLSSRSSEFTKRDMNNILTTVCCQVGCRKSDLTFLC
uniref:Relaxin-3-like n=1 Tax=Acanthochromis polyacanthus TaxID=80966 RepID=A0A3Q1G615_9TELE